MTTATAVAHPNIALVKYWGKRDIPLNLPAVGSLSLTLDGYQTRTTVQWGASADSLLFNDAPASAAVADKVFRFLNRIDANRPPCAVTTHNNFPAAAGLASSSSGFAALALAACAAAGQSTDPTPVSRLARQGSGSACRSLWGGFVHWKRGQMPDGSDSHGVPIALAAPWPLAMVVAVVSKAAKPVGSTQGMVRTADTSPYYAAWVQTAERDVTLGIQAVQHRDLQALGVVMEQSTFKMHATMHTAWPPIVYWQPQTVAALHAVHALRDQGLAAYATMDAGPNVKVLCHQADAQAVAHALQQVVPEVSVHRAGGPARLIHP